MFKLLESGNVIEVRIGNIEDQKGDAIINWTNLDMNGGPETWYKIHRKAGAQLRSATFPFQQHMKTGDVISTIAGLLDFYIVLHAVLPLPEEKHLYSIMMFNVINTIEEYKKTNVCRNVYLTFPDLNKKLLLDGLLTYESKLDRTRFVFMVDEDSYKEISELVDNQKKNVWKNLLKHLTKYLTKDTTSSIKRSQNSKKRLTIQR